MRAKLVVLASSIVVFSFGIGAGVYGTWNHLRLRTVEIDQKALLEGVQKYAGDLSKEVAALKAAVEAKK